MQKDPEKNSLLSHLLADRRYAAMLGLGFSAGIPYLLVYSTQSAWLSEAKVPIETIGLMSEFTIEAVAWVKRCPNPMPGPSEIEIRPLYEAADLR